MKKLLSIKILIMLLAPLAAMDPYLWLEDMESAAVWEWTEKQNGKTDRFLSGCPSRSSIEKKVADLSSFGEMSLPVKRGDRLFYLFQDAGMEQAVLKMGDSVVVDPNGLTEEGTVSLAGFEVDQEGAKLAYGLSEGGTDLNSWRFIDLETGSMIPDVLNGLKFSAPKWSKSGGGVYYTTFISDRKQGIFYHKIGASQDEDKLLYVSESDNWLIVGLNLVMDGRGLLFSIHETIDRKNGLFLLNIEEGNVSRMISPGIASHQYIGEREGKLYVLRDQTEVVAMDSDEKLISSEGRVLVDAALIGDRLVCHFLRDAVSELKVFDREGRLLHDIDLPGLGAVTLSRNEDDLYYGYDDFTTPFTIFRFDFEKMVSERVYCPDLSWDPSGYTTRQVFFPSKDGTLIPMFITHKKGLELNGETPALLYGYGGFNIPLTPNYSLLSMAWLENGGVYAAANLRGGGEYGADWYDAGRLNNKQNVFDDFISAAEWLIANGYTTKEKLAVNGRSNGGLLVGAVLVQRPDLFGAAVPQVGVLDMLSFHRHTIGWCWKCDYGDPENPEDRAYLLTYSPLHNVQKGARYPATLITTSDHDDRVVPMHSYKFAAALQEAQAAESPILLRVYRNSGHRDGRSSSQLAGEVSDIMMFLHLALQLQ